MPTTKADSYALFKNEEGWKASQRPAPYDTWQHNSNEQFENFYMHPAEEPIYRRSGKAGTVIPIVGGEVIDLGGRPLKIIELPGHTPGSIAVLDVKNRVLISGDPIQEDGRIFMFGDHRNMNDYVRSMEQLEKRVDEFDEIWPSHARGEPPRVPRL